MTMPDFPSDFTLPQLLHWLDEAVEEASVRWSRENGGERFRDHFAFAMASAAMVCVGLPEARLAIVRIGLPDSALMETSIFAVQVWHVILHARKPTTVHALEDMGRSVHRQELDLRNMGEQAGDIQCQVEHPDPSSYGWMFEGNLVRAGGEHIRAQRQAFALEQASLASAPVHASSSPRL